MKNIDTNIITTVRMKRNLILSNTQNKTPITAIMLNHAALQDDKTIATHSIAKLIMIKSRLCGFMFGMNRNLTGYTLTNGD